MIALSLAANFPEATVTATDLTDGTKTANTSPSIPVSAGAFTKLQILAPGESAAPGTTTGKTGTAAAQTAGASFNVTVKAVDANWNLVTSANGSGFTIHVVSSDPNATLPAICRRSGSLAVFAPPVIRAIARNAVTAGPAEVGFGRPPDPGGERPRPCPVRIRTSRSPRCR